MAKYNDGKHIWDIITRVGCRSHKCSTGTPCWSIIPSTLSDTTFLAVCDSRIRAAGFTGKITQTSVQTKKALMKEEVYA